MGGKRAALQCIAALLVLAGWTVTMSYLTWQELATPRTAGSTTTGPREAASIVRQSIVRPSVVKSTSSAGSADRGAPATNGTSGATAGGSAGGGPGVAGVGGPRVATAVIVAILAAGAAAARRVLRWWRAQQAQPHLGNSPESDDAGRASASEQQQEGDPTAADEDQVAEATGAEPEPGPPPATSHDRAPGSRHTTSTAAPPDQAPAGPRRSSSATTARVIYDRRTSRRVPHRSRAVLQWEGHVVACTTKQISLEGLSCSYGSSGSTGAPLEGTVAQITLTLDGNPTSIPGRIIWSRTEDGHRHLGLDYSELEDLARSRLTAFLRAAPQDA